MLEHLLLLCKCTQFLLSLPEEVALQALQTTLVVPETAQLKQSRCRCGSGYAVSRQSGWLHLSHNSSTTLSCSSSSIGVDGVGVIALAPGDAVRSNSLPHRETLKLGSIHSSQRLPSEGINTFYQGGSARSIALIVDRESAKSGHRYQPFSGTTRDGGGTRPEITRENDAVIARLCELFASRNPRESSVQRECARYEAVGRRR